MPCAIMPNQQPNDVLPRYEQENVRNRKHSDHAKQQRKVLKTFKSALESKKHFRKNLEKTGANILSFLTNSVKTGK